MYWGQQLVLVSDYRKPQIWAEDEVYLRSLLATSPLFRSFKALLGNLISDGVAHLLDLDNCIKGFQICLSQNISDLVTGVSSQHSFKTLRVLY